MRKQQPLQDNLPEFLRAELAQLKQHSDTQPLPADIETRLYQARQAALGRFSHRKRSQQQPMAHVMALISFGHPRAMGAFAFSVCLAFAVMLWMGLQHNNDALMLGDDMPIEAYVDNGFEPWGGV